MSVLGLALRRGASRPGQVRAPRTRGRRRGSRGSQTRLGGGRFQLTLTSSSMYSVSSQDVANLRLAKMHCFEAKEKRCFPPQKPISGHFRCSFITNLEIGNGRLYTASGEFFILDSSRMNPTYASRKRSCAGPKGSSSRSSKRPSKQRVRRG